MRAVVPLELAGWFFWSDTTAQRDGERTLSDGRKSIR